MSDGSSLIIKILTAVLLILLFCGIGLALAHGAGYKICGGAVLLLFAVVYCIGRRDK